MISSLQQAFNATVAIHHMKKLQLAHSEACLRLKQTPVPEIKVIATSTPESVHKKLLAETPEPNGSVPSNQMNVPSGSTESKSHFHPVRVSHSETTTHVGTLTIAEKSKHVYHSQPADLNGYVFVFNHGKHNLCLIIWIKTQSFLTKLWKCVIQKPKFL